MRQDPDCLFCRIVKGETPSVKVYEDDAVLAFRDIRPAAPSHVLVIPKSHVATLSDCGAGDRGLLADVMLAVGRVAELEGLDFFRVVFNNGSGAGQTVFHLHAHVLGGAPMGEKLL